MLYTIVFTLYSTVYYGFHFSRILIFREKRKIKSHFSRKTKNQFASFFAQFLPFLKIVYPNVAENFNFWLVTILKTIFQNWIVLRTLQNFKKSSKMTKIMQKMKKIDFSFFAPNFSRKNEK